MLPERSQRAMSIRRSGKARGRLLKPKLIEAYGPDVALPDLRSLIARCDRVGNMSDPCGAYYVALNPG